MKASAVRPQPLPGPGARGSVVLVISGFALFLNRFSFLLLLELLISAGVAVVGVVASLFPRPTKLRDSVDL